MFFRLLALLFAATMSSGCGLLLQSAVGWRKERVERTTQTETIEVVSNPPGAQVTRADPNGSVSVVGATPMTDQIRFEVEEKTEGPSIWGLLVGGLAIDIGGGATLIAVGDSKSSAGAAAPIAIGTLAILLAAPADLLTALIYGLAGSKTTKTSVPDSQSFTYAGSLAGYPEVAVKIHPPDQRRINLVLDQRAFPTIGGVGGLSSMPAVAPSRPAPSLSPPPSPPRLRPSKTWVIAVMEVEDTNSGTDRALEQGLLRNLGDQLRIFVARQGVKTIDRGAQERYVKEQITHMKNESFKSCYDDSCQIELGKALAASHILRSRITRFGQRCVLNAEVIDLRAEVTLGAASSRGDCKDEGFLTMSEEVAGNLFAALDR